MIVNTCKNVSNATSPCPCRRIPDCAQTDASVESLLLPLRPMLLEEETRRAYADLMGRRTFFQRYPHFLRITFQNLPKDDGLIIDYVKWQMKYLLRNLDRYLLCAEIYEHFLPVDTQTRSMYIGLELQKGSEPSHVHPIVNAFRAELSTRSRRQNIPMSDVV